MTWIGNLLSQRARQIEGTLKFLSVCDAEDIVGLEVS